MKLCPLFQTLRDKPWCHITTLERVQRELPREAIAAAIDALVSYDRALLAHVPEFPGTEQALNDFMALIEKNAKHIEQLRAMLPHDAADLTASDSGLHGQGER